MSNSDTANIIMTEKRDQGNAFTYIAVAVIVSCVVAVAALIVAVVGVAKQSSIVVNPSGTSGMSGSSGTVVVQSAPASGTSSGSDKVWRFHIGHFLGNTQYIDETSGQVRGYDVDVVNKVCQIANKNCVIAWDIYENCWDSQVGQRARGGIGLMGNWYDACIGWLQTRDRKRTYDFSNEFGQAYPVGLFVKTGRSIRGYPNLGNTKIGILDGWYADEHCLARYVNKISGFVFDEANSSLITHYRTEQNIIDALDSETIEAAFVAQTPGLLASTKIMIVNAGDFANNECVIGGVSLMMPKANAELASWFNSGFQRLLGTLDYTAICQDLTVAHGGMEGYSPDDYCIQY